MTQAIFTKTSIKRKDIFEKFIQVMINGGWQLMNADTSQKYIMYSNGKAGDKKMYLEIWPYERIDQLGNSTYDMRNKARTSIASNGFMRWGKAYDVATDTMTYVSGWVPLPFYNTRNWGSYSAYEQWTIADYDLDFYYYVDKDRVMYFLKHWRYTNYENHFHGFGLPSESFVLEDYTEFPTNFISFGTSSMPARQQCWVSQKPKNYSPKATDAYGLDNYYVVSPMTPNFDEQYQLSEIMFGKSDEGHRFRLGGLYVVRQNDTKIIDGDLIIINRVDQLGNTTVEKYRYCRYANSWDYRQSFPFYAIAIRIE
jgi:hypothetical protein